MRTGKRKSEKVLLYKTLYTIIIILIYLVGRNLPLYGIDYAHYRSQSLDAHALLMQTISGDLYQCSIFCLGIAPYMIATMLVQMVVACRSADAKSKISPGKRNRLSLCIMLVLAVIQSYIRLQDLHFISTGQPQLTVRLTAGTEMIAGAVFILWLSERNRKYGIGGQTALILANMVDGIRSMLIGREPASLVLPLIISVVAVFVVIWMENSEMRIPVQRISIHNIYADKNYLAIKLNPIGIMPTMFSFAFFLLPQILLTLLVMIFPQHQQLQDWHEQMVLTKPLGVVTYLILLFVLTVFFSYIFVNPGDITEQFLKSGDSLLNIHAGKDTKRYLRRKVVEISLVSAVVMCLCLGVPLFLLIQGVLQDSALPMLPSSMMMLAGVGCNMYREVQAIQDYDSYKEFI